MKTKRFFPIVVFVVLFTFGVFYLQPKPEGFSYNWPLSKRLTYSMSYHSSGDSYGSDVGSVYAVIGDQSVSVDIQGELVLDVVSREGEAVWMKGLITPDTFIAIYNNEQGEKEFPKKDLEFYLTWDQKMGVTNIYTEQVGEKTYEHIIRDVLSLVNLQTASATEYEWEKSNNMLTGTELVGYKYISPFWNIIGKRQLEKTYIDAKSPKHVSGSVDYQFGQGNVIVSISGGKQEVFKTGQAILSKSNNEIDLRLISISDIDTSVDIKSVVEEKVKSRLWGMDDLTGKMNRERLARRANKSTLFGRKYDDLKRQLENPDQGNVAIQGNLVNSMAAYMSLYPMSAFDFMRDLNTYDIDDDQFGMISAAMGQTGTPEAQQAMIRYMKAEGESLEFKQVMVNVAFVEKPTQEAEEYMRSLHKNSEDKDIRNKAAFSLGIMASSLSEDAEGRADAIENELASLLQSSTSHAEKVIYIRAIANTADIDMVRVLEPYLKEGEGLTTEVLKALRDMESEESRDILLSYARSADRDFRYVAYQSLVKFEPVSVLLDQYEKALSEEKESHIAEAIVYNLNEFKDSNSRANDIVLAYAEVCPTDRLCKLARKES